MGRHPNESNVTPKIPNECSKVQDLICIRGHAEGRESVPQMIERKHRVGKDDSRRRSQSVDVLQRAEHRIELSRESGSKGRQTDPKSVSRSRHIESHTHPLIGRVPSPIGEQNNGVRIPGANQLVKHRARRLGALDLPSDLKIQQDRASNLTPPIIEIRRFELERE